MNPLQEQSQNCIPSTTKPDIKDKENQSLPSTLKNIRKVLPVQESLKISRPSIQFGGVIPGNICEQDFNLTNLTTHTLVVQVTVVCQNREYDDLDEYVFSARKLTGYDYNDRLLFGIQPGSTTKLKIALKVPNEKEIKIINGLIVIQAQSLEQTLLQGSIKVPIQSKLIIPSIQCPKLLSSKSINEDVIQLAFKTGKKLDCKVPFKNNGKITLNIESGLLGPLPEEFPYELSLSALNTVVQPNSQFFLNVTLKSKFPYYSSGEARQVLVIKCKNSSVYFGFPIIIKVCE